MEWICAGAEEAQVEAVFEPSEHAGIRELLQEAGYPVEDLLVIRRTITRAADASTSTMKTAPMEAEVKEELKAIGMKEVDFRVEFRSLPADGAAGSEEEVLLAGEKISPSGLDQISCAHPHQSRTTLQASSADRIRG